MTSKLRVEIEDATAAGADSVANNVEKIGDAAQQAEGELNQVAKAADNVSDELSDAGKAASKLGADGKAGTDKVGLGVINLNQGLELLKKGFEVASSALTALAANGNPAAQSLLDSFGSLQVKLVEIGDDPRIMNLLQGLADAVENQVAPAVEAGANGFLDLQQTIANSLTAAGEYVGVFEAGVTDSFTTVQKEQAAVRDAQKDINEELRKTALVTGRVGEIEAKIAAEGQLRAIAAQESVSVLNALLDEEIEKRQELADAGELTGKKLEESDRRVETIMRRRADLPKILADKEKSAAQIRIESEKAVADAMKKTITDGIAAQMEAEKAFRTAEAERLAEESKKLEGLIAEAKAIFQTQQKPETSFTDARKEAVKRAQEAARKKAEEEGATEYEQGQAAKQAGAEEFRRFTRGQSKSPQEQLRDQVALQARERAELEARQRGESQSEVNRAGRGAGADAFRQFNQGKTTTAELASAQDALVQAQIQAAGERGQLDQMTVDNMVQAANNQQQLAASLQAQQQQMQQIQAALQAAGNSARSVGNTSRAQRGGYGR